MREPSSVMATSRSVPDSVNAADPDVVIVVRTTECGAGLMANHTAAPVTAATTNTTPVRVTTRHHTGLRPRGAADSMLVGGARLALFSSPNSAVEVSATR